MVNSAQIMRQTMQTGLYDPLQGGVYSAQKAAAAPVERSQAMGYAVEVMSDPMQELEDAMEELSFQFEEKAMKKLGDRKLGEQATRSLRMIEAIQKWQQVMPDMPGREFLERLLNQLRAQTKGGQLPTAQNLLNQLKEGSGDPSHLFAMLEVLESALGSNETELKELLAQAKQVLQEQEGASLRAGINIADEVKAWAESAEQMQELRDLYRGEVLGFKNPQACFRSLLSARGAEKLSESIDFLVKSCGVDLHSPSPSQSSEALARVLGDLQCVNVLTAVLDKFNNLAMHLTRAFGSACALNAEALTGKLLDLTEMPFVTASNIRSFVGSCDLMSLLAQVYFCTDLATIVRSLSSRLFETEDQRLKLVDAVQEHLDELVVQQADVDEAEAKKHAREQDEEEDWS